jgi:Tol biopolymer transport system component
MQYIAFEQTAVNKGRGIAVPRVWLLALSTRVIRPLFKDSQKLSESPVWSADGRYLAVYSASENGILIEDMQGGAERFIGAPQLVPFDFSPDGRWLCFPKLTPQGMRHAIVVDLTSPALVQHDITPQDAIGEYEQALWQPDSSLLLVQLALVADKTRTQSVWRLTLDDQPPTRLFTTHDFAIYNLTANGGAWLFERYTTDAISASQGVWLYQLADQHTAVIDSTGFDARWFLAQR